MSAGHAADYISDLRALIGDHPLNLMGAAAILLDAEGRVLLQKLAYRDVWGLPGGLCELAEAPEDTLRREVFEETALTVHAAQLLTLLTTPLRTLPNGHHTHCVQFHRIEEKRPNPISFPAARIFCFSLRSGYIAQNKRYHRNWYQAAFYTALYLVTGWEGEPIADGVESSELRFFAAHELPAPLRGVAGQWAADWLKQRI